MDKATPIYLVGLRISTPQNFLSGRSNNLKKQAILHIFQSGPIKIKFHFQNSSVIVIFLSVLTKVDHMSFGRYTKIKKNKKFKYYLSLSSGEKK